MTKSFEIDKKSLLTTSSFYWGFCLSSQLHRGDLLMFFFFFRLRFIRFLLCCCVMNEKKNFIFSIRNALHLNGRLEGNGWKGREKVNNRESNNLI